MPPLIMEVIIMWTKPTYENVRLGFEITMYYSNR